MENFMLFKMLFNIRILQDPLHKRAIKRIDGLKKVTGGKKESAFYKDIAEVKMCQCIMSQKQSFRFKKWVGQSALRHIEEDNQQWDGDLSLTK